jgi:hypothetical protein
MLTNRGVLLPWKTLIAIAVFGLAAGVGAFVAVQAQQGAQRTGALTAEDREEIRELLHRYMFYLDDCPGSNSGYDYADLYTEDGRFGTGQNRGREALARAAGRQPDGSCAPQRHRGPRTQIHLNVGEIIEPSPEGARATSYLLMIDGTGGQPYWDGWYEDILVKTPRGWRFKQRVHVNNQRAGISPVALQDRREIAAATATHPADPNIPISRNPVKWVDGIDTRNIEDTPAYAPGVGGGRQGAPPAGAQPAGRRGGAPPTN